MSLYPQRYIGFDKQCINKNRGFEANNSPFNEEKMFSLDKVIMEALHMNNYTKWFSIIDFNLELLSIATFCIDKDDSIFIWIWTVINCLLYTPMAVPLFMNLNIMKKNIHYHFAEIS